MKQLHYDNPQNDIIQITRREFREKFIDFITDNSFIQVLDNNEAKVLEELKNIILYSEFEDVLFGKEDR